MLKTFTNEKINNVHAYLIINENSKKAVLIDTALMGDEIIQYIEENEIILTDVFVTHYHFDHSFDLGIIQKKYNPKIFINGLDYNFLFDPKTNGSERLEKQSLLVENEKIVRFDSKLQQNIRVNGMDVLMIPFGGHTPGTTFYIVNNEYAFVGDTLFKNSIGYHNKTHDSLKYCDDEKFFESIDFIVDSFKKYLICPGHHEVLFRVDDVLANKSHSYYSMRK